MDKVGAIENVNAGRTSAGRDLNLLSVGDHTVTSVAQRPEQKNGTIDFADHGDIYKSNITDTIETKPGVSFAFKESAQNWWNSLPDTVQKLVETGKIKVILADNAMQVMPNADKIQARGHKPGETYAMQPGFYYPQAHALVLVEHHQLTPEEKRTQEMNERLHISTFNTGVAKNIAWHELGHALDYQAVGLLSHTKEFAAAYNSDCKRFTGSLSKDDQYYSQTNRLAAQEETLAQLFWLSHEPNRSDADDALFVRFPEVRKLMHRKGLI